MNEAQILLMTAASIAFLHTVLGPDHYLVFTAMGRARRWSLHKTLRITLICGAGHVLGSVLLGATGIILGAELAALIKIEGIRGGLGGWLLLAFGVTYFAWGLRQAGRGRTHSHVHVHDGLVHDHVHDHRAQHSHVHDAQSRVSITPWAMFVIFVFGPCEALIPLVMYPAAQQNIVLVLEVALVFGTVTLATMMAAVAIMMTGLNRIKLPSPGRWNHAVAGASVVLCGAAIMIIGL